MMHGIAPYVEIFEQKGVLIFFIYGLAYLINNTSFIGVYFFEIIAMTFTLYYANKCITLFLNKKWSYILIPIFATLICISKAFIYGGSVEEFCLPLMMVTLYFFLDFYKNDKITYKRLFIAGLCAGCVLISKYTILGFWFAFMACIFFCLIAKKEYKKSIISCIVFLIGMAIPFVIVLIYMAINGGVKEFFHIYFFINMTAYANAEMGLAKRLIEIFKMFINGVLNNTGIMQILLIALMPISLIKLQLSKKGKISLIVLYSFTAFGIYWGLKEFNYYIMPIQTCMIITLIGIATVIDKYVNLDKKKTIIIGIITIIISTIAAYFGTNYKQCRFMKKEDLFQFKFAEIINKEENPTLVNVGGLDCGVFTAANVMPTTYYVSQNNFDDRYPDNFNELKRYIREKKTMFVVYYTDINEETLKEREPELYENYDLITYEIQKTKQPNRMAYLFKRKGE